MDFPPLTRAFQAQATSPSLVGSVLSGTFQLALNGHSAHNIYSPTLLLIATRPTPT